MIEDSFLFSDFVVDTCGPPKIQNTMMNQTVVPGEYAHFKCQVHNKNVDFVRVS